MGHVPRKVSCVFSTFLLHGGLITCTITGERRYSSDLPQGGLELPCIYTFVGDKYLAEKAKNRLKEEGATFNGDMEQYHIESNDFTSTVTVPMHVLLLQSWLIKFPLQSPAVKSLLQLPTVKFLLQSPTVKFPIQSPTVKFPLQSPTVKIPLQSLVKFLLMSPVKFLL